MFDQPDRSCRRIVPAFFVNFFLSWGINLWYIYPYDDVVAKEELF